MDALFGAALHLDFGPGSVAECVGELRSRFRQQPAFSGVEPGDIKPETAVCRQLVGCDGIQPRLSGEDRRVAGRKPQVDSFVTHDGRSCVEGDELRFDEGFGDDTERFPRIGDQGATVEQQAAAFEVVGRGPRLQTVAGCEAGSFRRTPRGAFEGKHAADAVGGFDPVFGPFPAEDGDVESAADHRTAVLAVGRTDVEALAAAVDALDAHAAEFSRVEERVGLHVAAGSGDERAGHFAGADAQPSPDIETHLCRRGFHDFRIHHIAFGDRDGPRIGQHGLAAELGHPLRAVDEDELRLDPFAFGECALGARRGDPSDAFAGNFADDSVQGDHDGHAVAPQHRYLILRADPVVYPVPRRFGAAGSAQEQHPGLGVELHDLDPEPVARSVTVHSALEVEPRDIVFQHLAHDAVGIYEQVAVRQHRRDGSLRRVALPVGVGRPGVFEQRLPAEDQLSARRVGPQDERFDLHARAVGRAVDDPGRIPVEFVVRNIADHVAVRHDHPVGAYLGDDRVAAVAFAQSGLRPKGLPVVEQADPAHAVALFGAHADPAAVAEQALGDVTGHFGPLQFDFEQPFLLQGPQFARPGRVGHHLKVVFGSRFEAVRNGVVIRAETLQHRLRRRETRDERLDRFASLGPAGGMGFQDAENPVVADPDSVLPNVAHLHPDPLPLGDAGE